MARAFTIDEFAAFAGRDQSRWAWLTEAMPFELVNAPSSDLVRICDVVVGAANVELRVEGSTGRNSRKLRYPEDRGLIPRLSLGDDAVAREPLLTRWLGPLQQLRTSPPVSAPAAANNPISTASPPIAQERYPGQRRNQDVQNLRRELLVRQIEDRWDLMDILELRNITAMVHFTRVENLRGILSRGVLPRDDMRPDQYIANDRARVDGWPEASCFSISFPNYRILYRYRQADVSRNWVVLRVDPEQLLDKPCLYMPGNAASSEITRRVAVNGADFVGAAGLGALFSEPEDGSRAERGLTADLPTDPQAEVLIFEAIEPRHIRAVSLLREDPVLREAIRHELPGVTIEIGGVMFQPRVDYRYWRTTDARFDLDIEPTE